MGNVVWRAGGQSGVEGTPGGAGQLLVVRLEVQQGAAAHRGVLPRMPCPTAQALGACSELVACFEACKQASSASMHPPGSQRPGCPCPAC